MDEIIYDHTGYIARVRDPTSSTNVHRMTDLMHVVAVYDKTEGFNYLDLKKVVEEHNNLILFTNRIDKGVSDKISWSMTLQELARPSNLYKSH